VADEGRDVAVICAGSEGSFSIEDTLCGGMLLHLLRERSGLAVDTNDAASLALLLYRDNRGSIRAAIERGEHGRFLARLGFGADVSAAAQVDALPVLPVLHEGRLVLDEPKTSAAD
jgi:2-phosphosulfolactate phosphatase